MAKSGLMHGSRYTGKALEDVAAAIDARDRVLRPCHRLHFTHSTTFGEKIVVAGMG